MARMRRACAASAAAVVVFELRGRREGRAAGITFVVASQPNNVLPHYRPATTAAAAACPGGAHTHTLALATNPSPGCDGRRSPRRRLPAGVVGQGLEELRLGGALHQEVPALQRQGSLLSWQIGLGVAARWSRGEGEGGWVGD